MDLDQEEARRRFCSARFARLATVRPDGTPHVVPITFAVNDDVLVTGVDHKPKRTMQLQRLENLRHQPRCAVLVDHVDEQDWTRLWWIRVDGMASIIDQPPPDHQGLTWLADRYHQYRSHPPEGPLVVVQIQRWSGWSAEG